MARIGMDVDLVLQHGNSLRGLGDNDIPSLLGRVDGLIADIQQNWWGPDAQQFHAAWTETDRPALTAIGHQIAGFGGTAVTNAQLQQQKSQTAGQL